MSEDIDGLMQDLAAAQTEGRGGAVRHAEFRQVFLGSPAGKRVLHDILAWGHVYRTSFRRDPHLTAYHEGERNLALKILGAVHVEPRERPDRQRASKEA